MSTLVGRFINEEVRMKFDNDPKFGEDGSLLRVSIIVLLILCGLSVVGGFGLCVLKTLLG